MEGLSIGDVGDWWDRKAASKLSFLYIRLPPAIGNIVSKFLLYQLCEMVNPSILSRTDLVPNLIASIKKLKALKWW